MTEEKKTPRTDEELSDEDLEDVVGGVVAATAPSQRAEVSAQPPDLRPDGDAYVDSLSEAQKASLKGIFGGD